MPVVTTDPHDGGLVTTAVFRQAFQELRHGGASSFVTADALGGRTIPRAADTDK
ncbi:hypothetical protein ACFW7J_11325 [Streptomyces sp. NPDC059525]|uniref:hypothetical protein n=1 Tax=Streptomyces sp. NPDC059525 TaxID=3346857 RepID=UPI0036A56569